MIRRADSPSRPPRRRERSHPGPWLLIFTVAVILRVGFVLLIANLDPAALAAGGDQDRIAWNLARGSGFTLEEGDRFVPTAITSPLGPWLTSFVYRAFGHQLLPALLFQCVLAGLVPILVGVLGASMFGASIGRVAAWLTAASPVLVLSAHHANSGTLLALVLLAALAAVASWVKTPRPARAFGVGLLLGVASLTHVAAAPLSAIVLGWAWIPLTLTIAPSDRNRQMVLLVLGLALVLGPWLLRNLVVVRAPVLTTSVGRRLLEGNNDATWNRSAGPEATDGASATAAVRGRAEATRDAEDARAAWSFSRTRVTDWPRVALAKTGRFWLAGDLAPIGGRAHIPGVALAWAIKAWALLVLPLAIYGFAGTLAGARRWFQSLPAWVVFLFLFGTIVFYASLALRAPVEPLALLFAAAGFEDVRRRMRARGRGLKVIEGHR